jgi:FixJ family two-component response regulator
MWHRPAAATVPASPVIRGDSRSWSANYQLPHLSMVFITGHGDVLASVTAIKAGAVDFLERPVKSDVLLDAINRAVARSRKLLAKSTSGARPKRSGSVCDIVL